MKIVQDDKTFYIRWQYESPKLMKILREKNMPVEDAISIRKHKGVFGLEKALDLGNLPLPTVTHCIISDEKKNEIAKETVRKFPADEWNKDKARKFSLDKLLRKMFPNNKETRATFWRAYFNRAVVPAKVKMTMV